MRQDVRLIFPHLGDGPSNRRQLLRRQPKRRRLHLLDFYGDLIDREFRIVKPSGLLDQCFIATLGDIFDDLLYGGDLPGSVTLREQNLARIEPQFLQNGINLLAALGLRQVQQRNHFRSVSEIVRGQKSVVRCQLPEVRKWIAILSN